MFVGHYGVSFAAKRGDRTIPLWALFLAVQLLDVFWSVFVVAGLEKVRITPGITASNPLDLYYMPYTHSLVAALLWSLGAYVAYRAIRAFRASHRAALLVALAVFSHWMLDLVVHRPDLPLYDNTAKVGLGLWNYPAPAFLLEVAALFGGMFLQAIARPPSRRSARTSCSPRSSAAWSAGGSDVARPKPASLCRAVRALILQSSIHTGGTTCGHCFARPSSWLRARRVISRARRPPAQRRSMPGPGKVGRTGARRTPGPRGAS